MAHPLLHRRLALKLLGAAAAGSTMGRSALAQPDVIGRIIILSDLHSAYERLGPLLAALEAEIAKNDVPHVIAVNGDAFELGNVVATRSDGAIDWIFLTELARLAPTVLNIGNHEPDLVTDLAAVIAGARDAGLVVVSNIVDARTDAPYADASASMRLGNLNLSVVGIATNATATYPAASRDMLDIPDPVAWAGDNLPRLFSEDELPVLLSHAGVVADRAILPGLPDGALIVGGHDHLIFTHAQGLTRYVHTGSWGSAYSVAAIASDRSIHIEQVNVPADATASPRIAPVIARELAEHLTDADRAVVGRSDKALSLGDTGRLISAAMAEAAGADVGFINHTTLGTGLPRGEISKYRLDSVVRFDGALVTTEVDAAALVQLLERTNQDRGVPLSERTGDFLYAAPAPVPHGDHYRIVANDWSAKNQKVYFGREDLAFAERQDLAVKAVMARALAR
jgi:5'-nucleotidase / UDP-sugar diphosphatase